jgi:hypothetical protein
MKVFEVITEHCEGDSKEIKTTRLYVTSEDNTLKSVADYYTKHCYEYEKDLISVRDVLSIVENVKTEAI